LNESEELTYAQHTFSRV